jgi:NodT family efflux transporter outer membrane factor (OMF) lipoprotein
MIVRVATEINDTVDILPAFGALRLGRCLVLAGALMTSACAVGPDYGLPSIAIPSAWRATADKSAAPAPKLTQWWRGFNDPILSALVDEAIAGNLDVATAKARIREARANRQQAIGSLWPNASAVNNANWQYAGTSSGNGASPAGGTTQAASISRSFQAGFDASWEIDLFGGNARSIEAATYSVDASAEQLRSTLLSLIGDVAGNYMEARGYQARMALARRTAAAQRATVNLTKTKFDVGSAASVDVEKATAQALSTEVDLPTSEAAYAQTVHRLSILLGKAPDTVGATLMRGPVAIPRLDKPLPLGIPADILSNRPDVRLAERQLAQATAQIGVSEANQYPTVSLTGSVTTSGTNLADLGRASTIGWALGPSVSVPLFNGGALQAATDAARARRDESLLSLQSSVLAALGDVENAIVALQKERMRFAKLSEAAEHSRTAARLSKSLFETGTASFLDTLDAERSLYGAEDALLQSRVSIATDTIALAKALGGGWTGPIDAGEPLVNDGYTGPHIATPPVPPLAFTASLADTERPTQ